MFSQPYHACPESRKVIKGNIDHFLEKDCIEPVQSEWASPVVLVPKKDGSVRFCINYSQLNSLTVKDTFPLPRLDDS